MPNQSDKTIEEILEDNYSDPWTTELIIKEGTVRFFRTKDGKEFYVEEYKPEYGEIVFPDGLEDKLKNKTIEKQLDYFHVVSSTTYSRMSYGEISDEKVLERSIRLKDYKGILKLVVKDGIIVGARLRGYFGDEIVLPTKCICTYYASDNNGSGTNEREDYDYLICMDCK